MTGAPPTSVCLGLGSNVGDRAANLQSAVGGLARRGLATERLSGLYPTEPVGGPPQGWFLNAALVGSFEGTPRELLSTCLAVEGELGRTRSVPNAPRSIDIDILFYGDRIVDEPALRIPHPALALRRFVLAPLSEIAAEWIHPVLRISVGEILARCPDSAQVMPPEPWPVSTPS